MRIAICDRHRIFAESLAFQLTSRGDEVLAVVSDTAAELATVGQARPDICLVDVGFAQSAGLSVELRRLPEPPALVVMSDGENRDIEYASAAGSVNAIVDKSATLAHIIALLDQVHAGRAVPAGHAPLRSNGVATVRSDSQRLATFLTARERCVLGALVRGEDTARLARALRISHATTRCHIQRVLAKMGAHSRLEVAALAVREGIVDSATGAWLVT